MKIIVFANFGMGLYKFRKELLKELIEQNNDVYVSLPNDEYVPKLKELGCKYIETNLNRRGINPIKDLMLLFSYIKYIKNIRPGIVLTYTVKPNVYGGIACRITKTFYLTNVTGLGTSIENKGLIQKITIGLYRAGLKKSKCVFFQNDPNKQFFMKRNIIKGKTRVIPGSGVNLEQHKLEEYPENDEIINFLFIGRIMKAKGMDELLEAAKRVKKIHSNLEFNLIGFSEEEYTEQLNAMESIGIIKYHGQQDDIHSFIKNSHATILPSYHEGTANVLLESASTGRPVLASKVTGCIETFNDGISGIGFEAKNVNSLVDAIIKFINLPYEEKKKMGIAGRKKMEQEYDRQIVIRNYIEEINSLKRY